MNISVVFDWKTVAAAGAVVAGTILVSKVAPAEAKEVLIHAIDACRELVKSKKNLC